MCVDSPDSGRGPSLRARAPSRRTLMPRVLNPFSNVPSRREFIRLLALTGAAGASGSSLFGSRAAAAGPTFEEIPSSSSGITWIHDNAMSADRHLPETMGPGVAFFDYDNDGWIDIFMVNSGASDFYKPKAPLKNALYKNNRDGTFTDVTDKAGVAGGREFGMGCAIADYDNDGYQDILVTAYGRCTLYHNNGNGTFTDVTEKSGVATPGWTTSAVWFDYDNDGRLDLMLVQLRPVLARQQRLLRRQQAGQALLLHPARLQADTELALSQQRRRHVHRGQRRNRHPARARQGARRRRDRRQRRRADGPLRRQRHRPEFPVHESRQGQVGRDWASPPKSASASTAGRDRGWASMPPTSTATASRISSWPTSIRRCSRSTRTRATSRSRMSRHFTASRRRRGC